MVLNTGQYCYLYRDEVKSSVVLGFNLATQEGVLCEEPMRGVRFNLVDFTLHADARRRGTGHMIPTARRLPVADSLGFWTALREATGGTNVQFVFGHWQLVEGDPRDPSTRAGQLVLAVRRRKGLKEEIPSLNDLVTSSETQRP